ncbi:MAG: hypothetical protein A2X94_02265 [Bdellovibrionales bacterium GWB1_55_8]|nr:MAG: hypothetical protein A2X94_02265 [Bdellovibrionales bacterium GWB1_55_8]
MAQYFFALIRTSSTWGLIDFFALLPMAGVAIYLCKKWSYPIFLLVAGLTIYSNFNTWSQAPDRFPAWGLALTLFLDAVFVGYFLIPAVRTVYMDPRIRWWESKPRYLVNAPGSVKDADGEKNGTVADLSEGGIFFAAEETISPQEPVTVRFKSGDREIEVRGTVVYHRKNSGAAHGGYGVQFLHTRETACAVRKMVRNLRRSGMEARGTSDWREDLTTWFVTLAKTGKGLVPTPQGQRAATNNNS